MYRKPWFLAFALLCGLLLSVCAARAASPVSYADLGYEAPGRAAHGQEARATWRNYLPLIAGTYRPGGDVAPSPTASPSPTPSPTSSPTPTPALPSVYTGVSLNGAPWDMAPVTDWEQQVAGKPVSIIHFWSFWSDGREFQRFNPPAMDTIRNHGSIPMVTWAPEQLGASGPNQLEFRLANIIGGQYDAPISAWADAARQWGHPFFLRFAHEANGSWFPWGEDANGNQRGQFVQAWRHVHDLFTARNATNVTWVWCMNEDWSGSPRPSFASLYPGDAYVDWTCLDGYNWGTQYGGWRTFDGVFRYGYDTLLQVAPAKPVMLGEWATSGAGGSASDWITDAFAVQILSNYPQIRASVWYNVLTNVDWRVESWPGAPQALEAALSSRKYRAAEFGALSTNPIPAP